MFQNYFMANLKSVLIKGGMKWLCLTMRWRDRYNHHYLLPTFTQTFSVAPMLRLDSLAEDLAEEIFPEMKCSYNYRAFSYQ